jgi:hypothetical protein
VYFQCSCVVFRFHVLLTPQSVGQQALKDREEAMAAQAIEKRHLTPEDLRTNFKKYGRAIPACSFFLSFFVAFFFFFCVCVVEVYSVVVLWIIPYVQVHQHEAVPQQVPGAPELHAVPKLV